MRNDDLEIPDFLDHKPVAGGWRTLLKVHPACDLFPPMERDDLLALGQHVKGLWLDMHVLPVATQLAFGDIERIVLKLVDHGSLGPQGKAGVSRMKSKAIPKTPAATTA